MIRLIVVAGFAFIGCGISASYDACADSSAGRHDHASRFSLRRGQNTNSRCLRGKNHRASYAPGRPQVRARRDLLALMLFKLMLFKLPSALVCISGSAPNERSGVKQLARCLPMSAEPCSCCRSVRHPGLFRLQVGGVQWLKLASSPLRKRSKNCAAAMHGNRRTLGSKRKWMLSMKKQNA
jgi:hypothetical protein